MTLVFEYLRILRIFIEFGNERRFLKGIFTGGYFSYPQHLTVSHAKIGELLLNY